MNMELLELYRRASAWTLGMVPGASDRLEAATPCDDWDVRALLNHMLDTQNYFVAGARGGDASPPSPNPPELLSDDPVADFDAARRDTLDTFGRDGVIEKTGAALGIAFADQLVHGWDLATATGQDTTMPEGLPEAAYEVIHGRLPDEQRQGGFKPELPVAPDASAQDKLLAHTGRDPST
jgi:uncharacterized protein (TIGR03086 family)